MMFRSCFVAFLIYAAFEDIISMFQYIFKCPSVLYPVGLMVGRAQLSVRPILIGHGRLYPSSILLIVSVQPASARLASGVRECDRIRLRLQPFTAGYSRI